MEKFNKYKGYLLLLAFYCLIQCKLPGQNEVVRELGKQFPELSLSSYQVKADKHGVLWIGGFNGLYSYDGHTLKSHFSEELIKSGVSNIRFDSAGDVFARNFSSQLFKVHKGEVQVLSDFKSQSNFILSFEIDPKNRICLYYQGAFHFYTTDGALIRKSKIKYLGDSLNEYSYIRSVKVDSKGNYYLVNDYVIRVFRQKGNLMEETKKVDLNGKIPRFDNQDNLLLINDTLYIVGRLADKRLSKNNYTKFFKVFEGDIVDSFRRYDLGIVKITDVQLYNSVFAISTLEGLVMMESFTPQSNFYRLLESNQVTSMCNDFQGGLWVSGLNGLKSIPSLSYKKTENILAANVTRHKAMLNNGKFMITVDDLGNFYSYDKSRYDLQLIKARKLSQNSRFVPFNTWVISKDKIFIKSKFYTGKHFISTGIYKKNFREYVSSGDGVYASSTEGLFFFKNNQEKQKIVSYRTRFLHYSIKDGALLFSGVKGLMCLRNDSLKVILGRENSQWLHTMFSCGDTAILYDSKIGIRLFAYGKIVLEIPKSTYGDARILDVAISKGLCFIVCANKLIIYSLNTKNTITRDEEMLGIKNMHSIVVADGKLYLSGLGGVFEAPISELKKKLPRVRLILEEVFINESSVLVEDKLKLIHDQNNIVFKFKAVNFYGNSLPTLKYTLSSKNSSFEGEVKGEQLVFTALSPGDYKLKVVYSYHNEMDSEVIIRSFIISPPFWKTFEFIVLIMLLIGVIAYLFYKVNLKRAKARANLQFQLTQSQITSIKAQMNPHFIFNALNSIQNLVMDGWVKETSSYLEKFSTIIRSTLDNSEEDEINVTEEISLLSSYLELEKLRFSKDFNYTINLNVDSQYIGDINLPPMLLQPFVENSIKHGLLNKKGNKELNITFEYYSNNLQIEIKDNGVGRKRSAQINANKNYSFSTKANLKRIDLLNLNIEKKINIEIIDLYDKELAIGTKVLISIPQAELLNEE